MKYLRMMAAGCLAALTGGCASDFGNSVRHMHVVQAYNPAAVGQAPEDVEQGLDGARASTAVEAYRTKKPTPATANTVPMRIIVSE